MDTQRVGRTVFAVIGLAALGAGLAGRHAWQRHGVLASHADWPTVDGVVASVAEARDGQGEPFYWTTTTWRGPDGVEHRSESVATTRPAVGAPVPLRYDPADPAVAEPIDTRETWFPTVILGALGIGFVGIAVRSAITG